MTRFRRFGAVCAALTVVAVFTSAQVWGRTGQKIRERVNSDPTPKLDTSTSDDLAAAKFSSGRMLTYRTQSGEALFAVQVKPALQPGSERPRDYLIMVDTSASQIGLPLTNARRLTEEVARTARPEDRISLWTVNIPEATRDLTRGFRSPGSPELKDALERLRNEVPLGATDLKQGLARAARSFEIDRGRQRVVLFLGDGMSTHNPISASERSRMCDEMVRDEIVFYPVPLGQQLDPQNLHGFASGTGGAAVRILPGDQVGDTMKRLCEAVASPVLYPTSIHFNGAVAESFPTRLPPLRADAPTLVVGRLSGTGDVAYTIDGQVAGQAARVEKSEPVADPELDNFFLVGMVEQWKQAKDQPAIMQADRALAFANELNHMARAELLAQAEEALARDKFEAAAKLFGQAKDLDPYDAEAVGGLKVVDKIREGKLTKDQLREQFTKRDGTAIRIEKKTGADGKESVEVRRDRLDKLLAQAEQNQQREPLPAPAPGQAPANQEDLLRQQRQRQLVEEQRLTQTVDDTLREARRLLSSDPDAARDMIRRALAVVRDNPDLGDTTRQTLLSRMENSLRGVEIEGAQIRRQQAESLRLQAVAQERLQQAAARVALQEQTQARMRVFHSLMDQARFEEAYKQALAISQDAINQGRPIPVAVTAAYDMGLRATNLAEVQELRRVREERFLLTLLQVEKSHVPFPDEPPVAFPPAATWRELTRFRKERYESSGLTEDDPVALRKLKELKDKVSQPVTVEFEPGPLKDALGFLSERYGVPIIIDTEAFKSDLGVNDVENQQVRMPRLSGVSLGTVLRLLLAQVQGTFIIRREFIEVTTGQRQVSEKTLRVYPVADLVTPIPSSFNQQAVNQAINNSILGFQLQAAQLAGAGVLGTLALQQQIAASTLGALGLGGAGLAGVGLAGAGLAGVGGIGGIGGLGGGVVGIGGLGGNIGGIAGLQGGGAPQNLGVGGGGVAGFAGFGGQLGQLGNLGGQFGLQGGDQSQILLKLIQQVVGRPSDWLNLNIFNRPTIGPGVGGLGQPDDEQGPSDPQEANAIGYFPPSRALIVKGTSRVHTRLGGGILSPRVGAAPPGGAAALDKIKNDFLAKGGVKNNAFDKLKRTSDAKDALAKKDTPPGTAVAKAVKEVKDLDARKIWQDALAKGVTDPGLIIAVADFLVEHQKFDHAAEFLKANLRQAIVARPWVYEALAIALKEGKGSLEDIERAQLSAIDLEPQDTQGYLRAGHAMADAKRYDRALAFCRQAALLEPDASAPYADALGYAGLAKSADAMEWAAGNLLSRDWPVRNQELHDQARTELQDLAKVLQGENRAVEAQRLLTAVDRGQRRDLVMRLTWQGEADLDLEVREPVGTVCSFEQRQTPGGGILLGSTVSERSRATYAAAQAFPGDYEVTVRRIWGRPLGSKATLEVIKHQGTPEETRRRETIVFDRTHTTTVSLDDGRRKSLARVPPPSATQTAKAGAAPLDDSDRVLNKLRALADPDLSNIDSGMKGGVASGWEARQTAAGQPPPRNPNEQMTAQTPLASPVAGGANLMAQTTVSPGRYVRLSLAPVFETVGRTQSTSLVAVPVIPGGAP
jgi:tetratricopeptide (TPR) repeat protein